MTTREIGPKLVSIRFADLRQSEVSRMEIAE